MAHIPSSRGSFETAPFSFLPWVREPSSQERVELVHAKTGDRLADDTVVLREEDLDRMGLATVRHWLVQTTLQHHQRVLFLRRHTVPPWRDPDSVDDGEF